MTAQHSTAVPGSRSRQAAKSEATRNRIVLAVIGIIREQGLAAASSTEIARRAGVTWGAVQHHFGGKEEILLEVLERSHRAFAHSLAGSVFTTGCAAARVGKYVDAAWTHYRGDDYVAAMEILLATRGHSESTREEYVGRSREEHLALGRRIFHDSRASKQRLLEAIYLVHCMLTGILIETVLEGAGFNVRTYNRHLKKQVLELLY